MNLRHCGIACARTEEAEAGYLREGEAIPLARKTLDTLYNSVRGEGAGFPLPDSWDASSFTGVVFGAIRWRASGILGLILVHGMIDVIAVEMWPYLTIGQLGQVQVVHPVLVILGYGLILAVPIYLWKFRQSL